MTEKNCNTCKKMKDETEFSLNKKTNFPLKHCIKCDVIYKKSRTKRHQEIKDNLKKYYQLHRIKYSTRMREAYRNKHKELKHCSVCDINVYELKKHEKSKKHQKKIIN